MVEKTVEVSEVVLLWAKKCKVLCNKEVTTQVITCANAVVTKNGFIARSNGDNLVINRFLAGNVEHTGFHEALKLIET